MEVEDEDPPAVVIDAGSGTCMAGFAGDDCPQTVFSSVVGFPRFRNEEITFDSAIGDEAQEMREFLTFSYPIERGIVTNWDNAEKLWDHCFKSLRVEPTEHPVLMSEPVANPCGNREHTLECMFEKFQVPAFFLENTATLGYLNTGRGVGIVIDIGEGVTHVVPIHSTSPSPPAVYCQDFGGRDVTSYLQKLLHDRGYSFTTTAEWEYVREIKEAVCYTSIDINQEMSNAVQDTTYCLPDGTELIIGKEKFQCAECLFQPSLVYPNDNHFKGLHELLQSCLENCDLDIRKDFYCSVFLNGGTSLMPNLKERLEQYWKKIVPPKMVSRILAYPERKYSVWIGGSMLASLATFQAAWISKKEYEEFGPTIVHRRCM